MKSKILICALLCIGLMSFNTVDNLTEDQYVGEWSITVKDTPQGDMIITMSITLNEDGEYTAKLVSPEGDIPLEKFSINKGKLLGFFLYQEGDFELSGTIEKDEFEGEIYGMDMSFTALGKKLDPKE